MKIGFTGSQLGMTIAQLDVLEKVFKEFDEIEFHHGDCVGADIIAHRAAVKAGATIVIHPPLNSSKRAFAVGGTILEKKEYLVRNKDIVDSSELLFATPSGPEMLRSGTWSTVRYAKKRGKDTIIVMPDGSVS